VRPRRDPLVPPRRLQKYGRGEWTESGDATLRWLLDLAGLKPDSRVLDVGCGTGRVARPLVGFLDGGSYAGFDVDREAIGWCRRAYRRHGNAHFVRADLFHARFHPGGAHSAAEYRFPYDDASFDLVVATSVFPHLLEQEAAHYLAESARVLAPGGHLLATFFVLDEHSRSVIAGDRATFPFLDADQHVAVVSEEHPDDAVAYDAEWLAAAFVGTIDVNRGTWRGEDEGLDLLDVVVGTRA
jgi:SAM-dependent methyltransferase